MIATMMRLSWINLKRDRVALFLTFLLPLVFFSIFASIFGNMGGGSGGAAKPLRVLAVDEDMSEVSRALFATLAAEEGLDIVAASVASGAGDSEPTAWTREMAYREVRGGRAAAAVVLPQGFGAEFGDFGQAGVELEVIYDASNPMAQFAVSGLVQAAAFQAAPSVLMESGFKALEQFGGGGVTEGQKSAIASLKTTIEQQTASGTGAGAGGIGGLVQVVSTPAHDDSQDEENFSMVAYYAAGIGVMFLLFSMTGAAGTLLDEQDSGTLERLLASNLSMSQLLGGKWLFYALMGLIQVVLMFGWGAAVFGLDLMSVKTLAGFFLVAIPTAAAAAAFGLLLATLCQSRAQLGGLSTIVILIMSALGGSMVPRFVMPDFMDTLSKFTFNGWALDGFLKVFWYNDPTAGLAASLLDLAPQVLVLSGACVAFLAIARRLARRWERV